MNRAQMFRLIWIDMFVSDGQFPLQRNHLCLAFDISIPQASLDLKQFDTLFPGRLTYDKSRKGYLPTPGSRQVFDDASHAAIALACSMAAKVADRFESISR